MKLDTDFSRGMQGQGCEVRDEWRKVVCVGRLLPGLWGFAAWEWAGNVPLGAMV